jgi:hypothetical protein
LNKQNASKEQIFHIAAFMVTSARGLLDEPRRYGTTRLLEALEMLLDLPESKEDSFLAQLGEKVDRKNYAMSQVGIEGVKRFLDELVMAFVDEAQKRMT